MRRQIVLKPIMMTAVALLFVTPAMAQMGTPAKPAPAKTVVAKAATQTVVTKKSATVVRGPAKPRTAKSLACSKDADAKNLHGAPRDKFMRACNK
jgi:hypothetical protein